MSRSADDPWSDPGELARAALLGAGAGVIAAAATSLFQAAWTRAHLPPTQEPSTRPSPTEVLADELAEGLTGDRLSDRDRRMAGEAIHYLTGAGLGAAYALLARFVPRATAGRGAVFGLGAWATVEECGLALMGLKPPPWRVACAEHLFAASSHLVFGLSLDAVLSRLPRACHRPAILSRQEQRS